MSPMNRVARRELPLLILFCSFSARLFAAPLITYPLGVSTGANRLLDVSSGSTQFWLTSGLSGTEPMSAEAGKGTPGSDLTSSAGTAGVQNGPQSGDGSVGSAGGFASDQGSAHTGEATSETQGTSQTADTGSAGQVTIHPDGSWVGTAKGRTGRIDPADGAIQSRMRAADPAETNRASAGQVWSRASGSGASQHAGAAADATSGSRSPSNTQGKGTTDTIAPVPSLALSSPTVSSQQAVTPPGQSGSVSSSQASQMVSNPQGSCFFGPDESHCLEPAGGDIAGAVGLGFVEPGKPGGIEPTRIRFFGPVESHCLEPAGGDIAGAVGLGFVEPGKPGGIEPTRIRFFGPVESHCLEPAGGDIAGAVGLGFVEPGKPGGIEPTRIRFFGPVESHCLEPAGGDIAGAVGLGFVEPGKPGGIEPTRIRFFGPVESHCLEPVEPRWRRADAGGNAGSLFEFGTAFKLRGGYGRNGDTSVGRPHAASERCGACGCGEPGSKSTFQQFRGHPIAPAFLVECTGNCVNGVKSTGNTHSQQRELEQRSGCGTVPDLSVAQPEQRAGRGRQYGCDNEQSGLHHERHERPLNRWNLFQHPSVRIAGELQSATSLGRSGESNPGESRAGRDLHGPCHGDVAPEHSRAAGSGHAYGACDRFRSEACVRARRSRLLVGPRLFNRTARRRPVQQGGRWRHRWNRSGCLHRSLHRQRSSQGSPARAVLGR